MTNDTDEPVEDERTGTPALSDDATALMAALTDDAFLDRMYAVTRTAVEDFAATTDYDVDDDEIDAVVTSMLDVLEQRARYPQPAQPQTVQEHALAQTNNRSLVAEVEAVALVNGLAAIEDQLSDCVDRATRIEQRLTESSPSEESPLTPADALSRVNTIEREVHDLLAEPVVRRDDAIAVVEGGE